jgi:hypothetical protein
MAQEVITMPPVRVVISLVASISFAATGAAAAEVCFLDSTSGQLYRFPGLKIPKKVGQVSPAHGHVLGSPVTGTLVRANENALTLGLSFPGMSCNVLGSIALDTLTGPLDLDCGLDGTYETEREWSLVACDADL